MPPIGLLPLPSKAQSSAAVNQNCVQAVTYNGKADARGTPGFPWVRVSLSEDQHGHGPQGREPENGLGWFLVESHSWLLSPEPEICRDILPHQKKVLLIFDHLY